MDSLSCYKFARGRVGVVDRLPLDARDNRLRLLALTGRRLLPFCGLSRLTPLGRSNLCNVELFPTPQSPVDDAQPVHVPQDGRQQDEVGVLEVGSDLVQRSSRARGRDGRRGREFGDLGSEEGEEDGTGQGGLVRSDRGFDRVLSRARASGWIRKVSRTSGASQKERFPSSETKRE